MIFPQPLLLFLCAFIPTFFIYFSKQHALAAAWLGVIATVDIFNSQKYMNLSAILIFGVVCIPFLYQHKAEVLKLNSIKIFMIYLSLLCVLGIYHGFLSPWVDPTGHRSIKDQAQIRSILHLGRTFCEWSAILYMAIQLGRNEEKVSQFFLKAIFISAIIVCVGAFFEDQFQIDFYHFFTGGRPYLYPGRLRGLDYEPRGFSQNMALALLVLPFVKFRGWKYFTIPIFIYFGFYKTYSFSGLAVLGLGVSLLILFNLNKIALTVKKERLKFVILVSITSILLGFSIYKLPIAAQNYVMLRLELVTSNGLAEKFEVFDAAAINFLNHHPKYYPLGTGPGLVYLPATNYILERDQEIWSGGFEALPHVGAVLILSNAGLIGLFIFLFGIYRAYLKQKNINAKYLLLGMMLVCIYLIQLRYIAFIGLAYLLARQVPAANKTSFNIAKL